MSRSRIVAPFLVIGPLSAIVERQLRPTLEDWWSTFRASVDGWLTWKDLGSTLLGAAAFCYVIYLFTGLLIEKAAERLDTRYPAAWAQRSIQTAVALVGFPLLIWGGLLLTRSYGSWNWNAPVFGTPPASLAPVDNGAMAPRANDAEAPAEPERIPLPASLQSRPIILRPQHTAELLDRYGGAQGASYESLSRAVRLAEAAGDIYGPIHAEYLHYAAQAALTARMAGDEAAAIAIAAATAPAVAVVSDIFRRATERPVRDPTTPAGLK